MQNSPTNKKKTLKLANLIGICQGQETETGAYVTLMKNLLEKAKDDPSSKHYDDLLLNFAKDSKFLVSPTVSTSETVPKPVEAKGAYTFFHPTNLKKKENICPSLRHTTTLKLLIILIYSQYEIRFGKGVQSLDRSRQPSKAGFSSHSRLPRRGSFGPNLKRPRSNQTQNVFLPKSFSTFSMPNVYSKFFL
jgi:hypothetical protein